MTIEEVFQQLSNGKSTVTFQAIQNWDVVDEILEGDTLTVEVRELNQIMSRLSFISLCLYLFLSVSLSLYLSPSLSVCVFVSLSLCFSFSLSVFVTLFLSLPLSLSLSLSLPLSLSLSHSPSLPLVFFVFLCISSVISITFCLSSCLRS